MTGQALYERHSRVLYDTREYYWINDKGAVRTFDDRPAPRAWYWLHQREQRYWNAMARAIAPRKAKRS